MQVLHILAGKAVEKASVDAHAAYPEGDITTDLMAKQFSLGLVLPLRANAKVAGADLFFGNIQIVCQFQHVADSIIDTIFQGINVVPFLACGGRDKKNVGLCMDFTGAGDTDGVAVDCRPLAASRQGKKAGARQQNEGHTFHDVSLSRNANRKVGCTYFAHLVKDGQRQTPSVVL